MTFPIVGAASRCLAATNQAQTSTAAAIRLTRFVSVHSHATVSCETWSVVAPYSAGRVSQIHNPHQHNNNQQRHQQQRQLTHKCHTRTHRALSSVGKATTPIAVTAKHTSQQHVNRSQQRRPPTNTGTYVANANDRQTQPQHQSQNGNNSCNHCHRPFHPALLVIEMSRTQPLAWTMYVNQLNDSSRDGDRAAAIQFE